MKPRPETRDRALVRAVARWFKAAARELPWRLSPRDPYLSLVSEFMLQQTQVSRVVDKWEPFVGRFPTVRALAAADEDDVLALWSGMGYYRRARNLHAAAREVVARFGGRVPEMVDDLRTLPGVGPYTAGAISSIAFDRPAPIVDGNIARVLMRLEGKPFRTGRSDGMTWAWERSGELVNAAKASRAPVALLNEGLMELGAVICTPRTPACGRCPLQSQCAAYRTGTQDVIPAPKIAAHRATIFAEAVVVRNRKGTLVERRPEDGMWAGLWQAPTWERIDRMARAHEVAKWLGISRVRCVEGFTHQTTHRVVQFRVWHAEEGPARLGSRRYLSRGKIADLALSNPQRRILLGALPAGRR